MKNNKTILMITIISLMLVFTGITYAYFTAFNNEGSTAEISFGPGKMLIEYADKSDALSLTKTNIQPSDTVLIDKTFTLTGTNTATGVTSSDGLNMPYKVGLKYTSTFSDGQIHYYIKEVNRPNGSNVTVEYTGTTNQTVQGNTTYTGYSHGTLNKGSKYTEMVTGNFPASTSDQTITFNLILQFPDTGENQDSEKGATINGRIMVNYEPPKATTFAADSWENIAAVIQDGQIEAYEVGSEKEVEIDGKSYTVRVANNTTPEECNNEDFSQTACGFVLEFVDIIELKSMNSTSTNVGSWPASELRTYANSDFFNKLPSDLRNAIIDTKVVTGHGSTSGETNFISTDKIYLLSVHEVYEAVNSSSLSSRDTAYNNTRQLDYYKSKGVTTNSYSGTRKKLLGSSIYSNWWLRAAYSNYNYYFLNVYNNGHWDNNSANDSSGVSPAFRIG